MQYFEKDGEDSTKGSIIISEITEILPGQVKFGFNIFTNKKKSL